MRPADRPAGIRDRSKIHPQTVAVIPARYASSRFPGKALAEIAGRPMIEHVYRRAAAAELVDEVIVATDDERIAEAVHKFGGSVRMTRSDHVSGSDRIAEVAASLECELIVNVQGDEPLLDPAAIDSAVEPFLTGTAGDVVSLYQRLAPSEAVTDPNIVKVVTDLRGMALYFSRAPLPYVRDENAPESSAAGPFKHIGLYVQRRDFLLRLVRLPHTPLEHAEALEQLRVLEHGFSIKMVETTHECIGVDTPADLERVRRLMTGDRPQEISAAYGEH